MNTAQFYARAIINRAPGLSNSQVRLAVLDKTGVMMSETQINAARQKSGRVTSTTDKTSYAILLSEGWTSYEARELLGGLKVSIDSPLVMAMRRERVNWLAAMMTSGLTHRQVMQSVSDWYASDSKRSPFEFLRREYKPPLKVNRSEYRAAAKRRASRRTSELYSKRPKFGVIPIGDR